ncbi:peptidase [Nibricoccus aquaticus]|uniref:Peptidase n=1 Tax=Nibricoccus aquaticus TaxID=2576891 RepID=A0A290QKG4_9BACT|nr:PepSY-associated TM helix domain-containing protein [Nibricoccus aquaticus]ATC64831.1 peptidase [Nibricoccus aquaticus]
MKTFRKILFWSHLVAGLISGLSIGIMCFTGTILAFEHELADWSERDARKVAVPADTTRLSIADLQRKLRETQPDFRATGLTLLNDPAAVVTFTAGRDGAVFANPYTGEFKQPASTKVHDFMHLMIDWHRFLGREGEQRPMGKLINGICNIAFFALAVTGLYLWMPRNWSWRGIKAVTFLNFKASGLARDFNWHNAIGFWSAPILIVLTLTAVPISFRWGGDLIYKIAGEEPPLRSAAGQAGPGGPANATPAFEIVRPSPDARPLPQDTLIASVQKDFPRWEQITVRTGGAQRGQRAGAPNTTATSPAQSAPAASAPTENPPAAPARPAPQPVTIIVRESDSLPRTATTTLTLNPFTGEVLKREGYADLSTARQIRSWTRYLHTGQALGWPGQLIAGLACLGGCFLVYTGFALSYRRFFKRRTAAK